MSIIPNSGRWKKLKARIFLIQAEEDSIRPTFKTNAGRIVYGGGGITPDFIVKSSSNMTEYTTKFPEE
jgi:hypothetical protein